MESSSSDFADHLKVVQEQADQARRQVDLARQQLEHAQRARGFWDDLAASLARGHAAQALLLLRREAEVVRDLQGKNDHAVQNLRELHVELRDRARSTASSIAREFPTAVRDAGIQIDTTSRHPTYTFHQGFLRLEMDERNFTAKLVPRDGDEIVVGLDLGLVVETIRSEHTRLFQREVDTQSFLRSLYTAYAAVLRAENRPDGDEVPLRRVTNRLAKNLNRFAADEFNVDLSRLVQKGDLLVDGKRVHLNHTRDRRQGMLLNGLESGGYVGFISFKTEKQG
jgi:hypothetical protein